MTDRAAAASTHQETPFLVEADGESVFGVWTRPSGPGSHRAVVVVPGGWVTTSTGRNRVVIRLCRRLAGIGYHAVRFDYGGVGDSSGSVPAFLRHRPPVADLRAAVDFVKERGVSDVILVGLCIGSWSALSEAATRSDVAGLVLVSPPIRERGQGTAARLARANPRLGPRGLLRSALRPWVIRGLFDRYQRAFYVKLAKKKWLGLTRRRSARREPSREGDLSWVSRSFLAWLRETVGRRVPVLILFGTEDPRLKDFREAWDGGLGDAFQRWGSLVQSVTVEGSAHAFEQVQVQEDVIRSIADWARLVPGHEDEPSEDGRARRSHAFGVARIRDRARSTRDPDR